MADYTGANNSSEKPKWMQEPSLKGISMEKLDFLQKMVFESSQSFPERAHALSYGSCPEKPGGEHYFYPGGNDGHH